MRRPSRSGPMPSMALSSIVRTYWEATEGATLIPAFFTTFARTPMAPA